MRAALIGCAPKRLYQGPSRPASDVAVVRHVLRGTKRAEVYLEKTDEDSQQGAGGSTKTLLRYHEVLPGLYKISAEYIRPSAFTKYYSLRGLHLSCGRGVNLEAGEKHEVITEVVVRASIFRASTDQPNTATRSIETSLHMRVRSVRIDSIVAGCCRK